MLSTTSALISTTSDPNKFQKLVKVLKTGKSAGNNHIVSAENLKHGGDQFI